MIDKTNIERKITQAIEISKKYSLVTIENELKGIEMLSRQFKICVLLIGSFSAGKSALLNRLIGKQLLAENQAPETALATELYFSEEEKLYANYVDGSKKVIQLSQSLDVNSIKNIEFYINSENLKAIPDFIMVDTPGFDSGIEKHNKALMQYIDNGTVFILVVDCEKGTISESALNFLNEVSHYSEDVAVIINKCDKKISSEVEKIKSYIDDLLLASCGRNFPIICTSKKEDDVDKKLLQLISGFDAQRLYEKNIGNMVDSKCNAIIEALNLVQQKKECNTKDYDEEIEKRELARKRLLDQIETQKKKVGMKLHKNVKERIIGNVQAKLMSNVQNLATAYKGGIELFQQQVIELIRPVMIEEVGNFTSVTYEDFVRNLNLENLRTDSDADADVLCDILSGIYDKIKVIGENQPILISDGEDSEMMDKGIAAYRAVSSILAIATEFVAPPLEILIVFLPDIIRLLRMFGGDSKEQKLIEAIQNQVIPQIVAKMRAELDNPLHQVESIMIENIVNNINEIIDLETDALETAKNKRDGVVQEYEKFVQELETDLKLLDALKQ